MSEPDPLWKFGAAEHDAGISRKRIADARLEWSTYGNPCLPRPHILWIACDLAAQLEAAIHVIDRLREQEARQAAKIAALGAERDAAHRLLSDAAICYLAGGCRRCAGDLEVASWR